MDILWTTLGVLLTILGWLFAILWWFLSFFLMPLLVLAAAALVLLRFAWRTPRFRPMVERLLQRLGDKGFTGARRLVYLVTVEPFRVIFRFIWFSLLYAWVDLWWKPKWTPWTRARQRPKPKEKRKSAGKA